LRKHHPRYADKLEITTRNQEPEKLTPEQEKIIQEALQATEPNPPLGLDFSQDEHEKNS